MAQKEPNEDEILAEKFIRAAQQVTAPRYWQGISGKCRFCLQTDTHSDKCQIAVAQAALREIGR